MSVFWFASMPNNAVLLLVPSNPSPLVLAAAAPSPNTSSTVEPRELEKVGAELAVVLLVLISDLLHFVSRVSLY